MARNKTQYNMLDCVAYSIMAYADQGFVRSGEGRTEYDEDGNRGRTIFDNKTVILNNLIEKTEIPEDVRTTAQELIDKMNGKFMMKKLTQSFLSSFETNLSKYLSEESVDNYGLAIIASLPHMEVIDRKRQDVTDRLEVLRYNSDYFGERAQRYDITVEVLDTKFIQSSGVYMITTIHNDKDIIKFWWRDQPDLTDIIDGRIIKIRGTVKNHELSKYTQAKETMLNRVKILQC